MNVMMTPVNLFHGSSHNTNGTVALPYALSNNIQYNHQFQGIANHTVPVPYSGLHRNFHHNQFLEITDGTVSIPYELSNNSPQNQSLGITDSTGTVPQNQSLGITDSTGTVPHNSVPFASTNGIACWVVDGSYWLSS
jgi:hypothetical protein